MRSKLVSTLAVVAACCCLIGVVSAQGVACIGKTIEWKESVSGTASFGVDFYTKIYATKLSNTKPVVKTTSAVLKLIIWSTITESEEKITELKKVYANYWSYVKSARHKVTWENTKDSSSITGNFESYNG